MTVSGEASQGIHMAPRRSSVFDPTEYFALQDIALWSTTLSREGDYQPEMHEGKCSIQTMRSVRPEVLTAVLEGSDEEVEVLRTFVSLGVRSVLPKQDANPETILFTLEATFSVEYIILKAPEQSDFVRFVDFNCIHNAWPFWRQHVYDMLKRASLPVPAIPLFTQQGTSRKRKKISRITKRTGIDAIKGN